MGNLCAFPQLCHEPKTAIKNTLKKKKTTKKHSPFSDIHFLTVHCLQFGHVAVRSYYQGPGNVILISADICLPEREEILLGIINTTIPGNNFGQVT